MVSCGANFMQLMKHSRVYMRLMVRNIQIEISEVVDKFWTEFIANLLDTPRAVELHPSQTFQEEY
jgi:hypothetical protein